MTLWEQISNDDRDLIVARVVGGLEASGVPEHLRDGLVRYFADGILPGSFLQAVLVNDLNEAYRRADPLAGRALMEILGFLYDYAPKPAWGTRARVLAWTTTPNRLEV